METFLELEHKGKKLQGILIKENKEYLTLKLSSGYNANLKQSEIKILKREQKKDASKSLSQIKQNEKLPKIAILHTGGTIASKVDYETGAVSSKFTPEELLGLYPELNSFANLQPEMIANLSSEDIRFKHYNLLLDAIKSHIKNDVVGIIISHGTDTMHYTSAALQYALKNLSIPVILVGAQRSSDRPSSDASSNLKAAIEFIMENSKLDKAYRRVGICMHRTTNDDSSFVILDGINAKKMHSSRRDSFKQINYKPYAEVVSDKIRVLRENIQTSKPSSGVLVTSYKENLKIGFFKAHPNLFPEEIDNLSMYDGVVFEGTGLGHLAVSEFDAHTKLNPKNLEALKKLMKKTKCVIGVQTVYGTTNMNIYSSGRYLKGIGILGQNMNLTTETLFCRLAYCLSQKGQSFEESWNSDLEGFEIRSVDVEED